MRYLKILEEKIEISGYDAKISKGVVEFGCKAFTKGELEIYKSLLERNDGSFEASIEINDTRITIKLLDKLIKKM